MPRGKPRAQVAKTPKPEGWKVRVQFPGGAVHVLSRTAPMVRRVGTQVLDVDWDLVTDTEHGDTVGYIRWSEVIGISWRRA